MSKLTWNDHGLAGRLRDASRQRVRLAVAKLLRREGQRAENRIIKRLSSPGPSSSRIQRRTGQLARSIAHETRRTATGAIVEVGHIKRNKALAYAAIHEFGGVIEPKRSKFLTIPLKAAKTRAGVPRFRAREAKSHGFIGTFFRRISNDSGGERLLLIGVKTKKRGKFGIDSVPLFLLVKQVTIPARPHVRPEGEIMKNRITAFLAGTVANAMQGEN